MATYEKMVLISEVEYMNLKNYKYLPHEIEGDEESGYDDGGESGYDDSGYDDDDDDDSGYRPGRIWRQPQTPDDRHIQTPRPSPKSARRSVDLTSNDTQSSASSDTQSSASSARSSMSSGDARALAEAAQRIQEQRIEELRRAEETAQIAARMRAGVLADEEARRREDDEEWRREEVRRAAQQYRDEMLQRREKLL